MSTVATRFRGRGSARELLGVAMPLIISYASDTVMTFTDRLFLSRLSSDHMSAAMGGGMSSFTLSTFFVGLLSYATSMVAQRYGAQRTSFCSRITTQSLIVAVLAYPVMLALIPLGHAYFHWMGIGAGQLALQETYFDILMYGALISLLRGALTGFFSGVGRTRLIMLASLAAMVLDVGLNCVLVFGKLGFPALGIRGAAFGTLIAGAAGLGIMAWAYLARGNRRAFAVGDSFAFDPRLMKELWRLGTPSGLDLSLNLVAFTTLITLFHACSPSVAAAATITFNWDSVSFIPLLGINVGVTSLVGRYAGAGDLPTAHRATMSGLWLACGYSLLFGIVFVSVPGVLVDVFQPSSANGLWPQTRETAIFMVRLISIYVLADAVSQVYSGALRGVGDTLVTMLLSVAVHWLLTGVAYVALRVLHWSPEASWVAVVVSLIVLALAYYARYRFGNWRSRALRLSQLDEPAPE